MKYKLHHESQFIYFGLPFFIEKALVTAKIHFVTSFSELLSFEIAVNRETCDVCTVKYQVS